MLSWDIILKKMKLKKPKFWDYSRPNFFAYILLPFSSLTFLTNYFKDIFFSNTNKKKFDKVYKICIGNIYVGGTGKTPISIEIKEILTNLKFKTAFIKKDYPDQVDEQKLLSNNGNLFCKKDRSSALEKAIESDFNALIFDDGLQDLNLRNIYDISIVCFNAEKGIGNGFLLPAGPLRESLKNLKKYNAVFLNGNDENTIDIQNKIKKINPNIKIFNSKYLITNLDNFDLNQNYLIFSGIGNPDSFIKTLKHNNFKIIKNLNFADHHNYSDYDIIKIIEMAKKYNAKILTTEKDYNRLSSKNVENIEFIKIKLKINNKQELVQFLENGYENN